MHAERAAERLQIVRTFDCGESHHVDPHARRVRETRRYLRTERDHYRQRVGGTIERYCFTRRAVGVDRLRQTCAPLVERDHVRDRQQLIEQWLRHGPHHPSARVAGSAGEKNDRRSGLGGGRLDLYEHQRQSRGGA